MNWNESKVDTILKMAVCLAMIGSLVGCSGGSSSSLAGATATPSATKNIDVMQSFLIFPVTPGSMLQLSTATLSIASSVWTYPVNYFSLAAYRGSATHRSGSHADSRPPAQGFNVHTNDRTARRLMYRNGRHV